MDSSSNSAANHHYALQVALQTMKARCIALQRRLTSVEEENKELREQVEKQTTSPRDALAINSDNVELRIQVSELQRQMTQLTEHSNMVSNENRKLWSKLSQISKEQSQQQPELDANEHSPRANSSNLNLIRSKTFTQHSPNPNLRHKLISNKIGAGGDAGAAQYEDDMDAELSNISLDDVNLNDLDEDRQQNGAVETEEPYAEAALAFGYLNEGDATTVNNASSVFESAFGNELKKLLEGLQAMRQAAQQQQDELYTAINVLECNKECAKLAHKPEMADKSLETDDSLNDVNLFHDNRNTRSSSDYNLSSNTNQNPSVGILKTGFSQRLNIIEEKIAADASDKTCPMCGKLFAPTVQFREFQEHVEMHFTEDTSDLDHSIERQYEYISHTVGDF